MPPIPSLSSFTWASDPSIRAMMQPYSPQSPFLPDDMFGDAIAKARGFNLDVTTGHGFNFGTGIIDTSIPSFGEGDGSGDGSGDGGGPTSDSGDSIESRGGRGGQSDTPGDRAEAAYGTETDPANTGGVDPPGSHDPEHGSGPQRDMAGSEVGAADPDPAGGGGFGGAYAEGGIVRRPTRALVGEGGEPEAIIPQHMLDDPDTMIALLRNLARRSPLDDPTQLSRMSPRTRALLRQLGGRAYESDRSRERARLRQEPY